MQVTNYLKGIVDETLGTAKDVTIADPEKLESLDKTREFITHCCKSHNACRRLNNKCGVLKVKCNGHECKGGGSKGGNNKKEEGGP